MNNKNNNMKKEEAESVRFELSEATAKKAKIKSVLSTIADTVSLCITVPIFAFLIMCSFSFAVTRKNVGVPMAFGFSIISISSESMLNSGFDVGDKAFVRRVDNYKVGDFVVFFDYVDPNCSSPEKVTPDLVPYKKPRTSRIVFHEIIEIITDTNGKNWYRTKGTNNLLPDGNLIYENYLIGKHVKFPNWILSIADFATTLKGVCILVVIPCCVIVFKDCMTLTDSIAELQRLKKSHMKK